MRLQKIEYKINEQKIANKIAPLVEQKIEAKIKYRIVRSIVDTLDEQFYPPEERIRKEFIKETEDAQKEDGLVLKNSDELLNYLDKLKE